MNLYYIWLQPICKSETQPTAHFIDMFNNKKRSQQLFRFGVEIRVERTRNVLG